MYCTPCHFILLFFGQGAGTDDNTLVRVVVTRSEVDMVNIKNAFRRLYGKTLGSFIKVHVHHVFFFFFVPWNWPMCLT